MSGPYKLKLSFVEKPMRRMTALPAVAAVAAVSVRSPYQDLIAYDDPFSPIPTPMAREQGIIPDDEIESLLSSTSAPAAASQPPSRRLAASNRARMRRSQPHVSATLELKQAINAVSASSAPSSSLRSLSAIDRELLSGMRELEKITAPSNREVRSKHFIPGYTPQLKQRPPTPLRSPPIELDDGMDVDESSPPTISAPLLTPIDYSAPPVLAAIESTLGMRIQFRSTSQESRHEEEKGEEQRENQGKRAPPASGATIDLTVDGEESNEGKDEEEAQSKEDSHWPIIDDRVHPVDDESAQIYEKSKRRVLSRVSEHERERYLEDEVARTEREHARQPLRRFLRHIEPPTNEQPQKAKTRSSAAASASLRSQAISLASSEEADFLTSPHIPPSTIELPSWRPTKKTTTSATNTTTSSLAAIIEAVATPTKLRGAKRKIMAPTTAMRRSPRLTEGAQETESSVFLKQKQKQKKKQKHAAATSTAAATPSRKAKKRRIASDGEDEEWRKSPTQEKEDEEMEEKKVQSKKPALLWTQPQKKKIARKSRPPLRRTAPVAVTQKQPAKMKNIHRGSGLYAWHSHDKDLLPPKDLQARADRRMAEALGEAPHASEIESEDE